MAKWAEILDDEGIVVRAIVFEGQVAGHISSFEQFGKPAVGYWLGKAYWGQGIATQALSQFLDDLRTRPLYARVRPAWHPGRHEAIRGHSGSAW